MPVTTPAKSSMLWLVLPELMVVLPTWPLQQDLAEVFWRLPKGQYENRNIRFGVREHGMGAICNGLALDGSGLIPMVPFMALRSSKAHRSRCDLYHDP